MEFDINHIAEILVRYPDGTEVVFRGRGLEKLRKLMKISPPLGAAEPVKKQVVVEEASSGAEESGSEEEVRPAKKSKKKAPKSTNGYSTVNLDYTGPIAANVDTPGIKKGLSPYDLARDMQRQAEATSKIKY